MLLPFTHARELALGPGQHTVDLMLHVSLLRVVWSLLASDDHHQQCAVHAALSI